MGKTGTSALQMALRQGRDALLAQGADYAGMDPHPNRGALRGDSGRAFFRSAPADLRREGEAAGRRMAEAAAAGGPTTTLLSNESFAGRGERLLPYIDGIGAFADVKLLAWVRNPQEWMPAAYLQWCVRHKTNEGPVPSYADASAEIVGRYRRIATLARCMGKRLEVRPYLPGLDIIADFGGATGIAMPAAGTRSYERLTAGESVLRAIFNDRIRSAAPQTAFDRAVRPADATRDVVPLAQRATHLFDYSTTDSIIERNRAIFDEVRDAVGIDPRTLPARPIPAIPPVERLREELFDMLLGITLDQARRIAALELALSAMNGGEPIDSGEDDMRRRVRLRRGGGGGGGKGGGKRNAQRG